MSRAALKHQARELELAIGVHQQQSEVLVTSLRQRLQAANGWWVPLGGALTGAALALVPLKKLYRHAYAGLSAGWMGIRWLGRQIG